MTQQKTIYTILNTQTPSRPIAITNTTITGSRFIKDNKTLTAYCREWLATTKGDSFLCLPIPTTHSYIVLNAQGEVHFVQFAFQKSSPTPTQLSFQHTAEQFGHPVQVFHNFQSFAAWIKKIEKQKPVEKPIYESQKPQLTAWGIQLPAQYII